MRKPMQPLFSPNLFGVVVVKTPRTPYEREEVSQFLEDIFLSVLIKGEISNFIVIEDKQSNYESKMIVCEFQ